MTANLLSKILISLSFLNLIFGFIYPKTESLFAIITGIDTLTVF
nr:MAG TPA: hypothetical protein [Caudoviricetes sp.]